ncbi:U-Kazal-Dg21.2-like isoform X2 [Drosophila takahashii]|uniref:U-Kazal-Dg21.2-like isoform X2 n=1 Tax=Drosophila takahashii TaxID=29030 RepID=UPI003899207A
MKSYIALCLIFSLVLIHANEDCPDTEDIVWALGGGCHVFRNNCFFTKANVLRKPELTITTKEECQKECPKICPAIYSPTMGTYKGEVREFSNKCVKQAHNCRTGETYV